MFDIPLATASLVGDWLVVVEEFIVSFCTSTNSVLNAELDIISRK
jgi:hypothetical protein